MKTFSSLEEVPESYAYFICDEPNKRALDGLLPIKDVVSLNWDPKYIKEMIMSILNGNTTEEKMKWGKKYYWIERFPA